MPESASETSLESNPEFLPAEDDLATPRPTMRQFAVVGSILLVGVVAMLVYHHYRTGGDFSRLLYGDEKAYYLPAGEDIRSEGWQWFFTERSLWTGPLNPIWVAFLAGNVALVKILNIGIFVLAGLAVWDIARRLFSNGAGYVAAALYAAYLPFYKFTPTLLTEPLFVSMIVFGLWFAVLDQRRGRNTLIATGALFGLAALARPTLQLFPLFLVGVWALGKVVASIRESANPPTAGRKLVLVCVGFAVLVVPYAVKNFVSLDKVGLANGSGAVLYLGNDLRTHGFEPVDSNLRFNTIEISAPYTHLDTEGDSRLAHAALERVRRDPMDIVLLQPWKALRLVFGSPGHYFRPQDNVIEFLRDRDWVSRSNVWELVMTPVLVVFGILGLVVLRTPRFVKLLFGSVVAYLILLNTLLFPIPRMFLAAFPVLAIFTAGAVTSLGRKLTLPAAGAAASVVLFIAFESMVGTSGTVSERYVNYFDPVVAVRTDHWVMAKDVEAGPGDSIVSTGADPYVVFDVEDFEATKNQMIFVSIRALEDVEDEVTEPAQIFWRTIDDSFDEDHSELFPLRQGDDVYIYAVSPSFKAPWSGLISEIRLDLPDNQPNRSYQIEGIEIRK